MYRMMYNPFRWEGGNHSSPLMRRQPAYEIN